VPFPTVPVVEHLALPSLASRTMCLTRLSDDPNDQYNRLRVERDGYQESMIELVDEQVSSLSESAETTHINDKLLLTLEDARWLRDALIEILGEEDK